MTSAPSNLEGTWRLVRAETGGENSPELVALSVELRLSGGEYVVTFAREVADRGTYSLSVAAGVEILTLLGTEGPNAGRTIPCLYQRVGGRLRVCYGLDGRLPTAFSTRDRPETYLATYRREE